LVIGEGASEKKQREVQMKHVGTSGEETNWTDGKPKLGDFEGRRPNSKEVATTLLSQKREKLGDLILQVTLVSRATFSFLMPSPSLFLH
jgi:hypothetical protein